MFGMKRGEAKWTESGGSCAPSSRRCNCESLLALHSAQMAASRAAKQQVGKLRALSGIPLIIGSFAFSLFLFRAPNLTLKLSQVDADARVSRYTPHIPLALFARPALVLVAAPLACATLKLHSCELCSALEAKWRRRIRSTCSRQLRKLSTSCRPLKPIVMGALLCNNATA